MRILITGLNGTVAPGVAKVLESFDHIIIPYDREFVSTESFEEIYTFIENTQPDVLLHFATGSIEWSLLLAKAAHELLVKFIYISSVSVFSAKTTPGPFTPDKKPNATDDYGQYKANTEKALLSEYPLTTIIRLGWQIDHVTSTNNMLNHLKTMMDKHGIIKASKKWYPSCSFIADTGKAILDIIHKEPDIYHVDSNDGYSFYELVSFLKSIHTWIKVSDESNFVMNNQLVDERVNIRKLSQIIKDIGEYSV
ncbi:sugar nucleotide-binding protein [Liberiplasma polymorphum]|uniref:sugar nucleotide-binding protein n=1 Tax=Liberiplasma polymorphum TaxID=3374570 RepID=UPI003775C4D7